MTDQPDYEGAIEYALYLLRTKLPADLSYHSYEHTAEDILPAVERLATLCQVEPDELEMLRVGAAYHDLGYINNHLDHEQASTRIAAQVLPGYGFDPEKVDQITSMIMATRLPQAPKNRLEEILVDADLDSLGREDFFIRSQQLHQELAAYGRPLTKREWYQEQLDFLRSHTYFTEAARNLRQTAKLEHIAQIESWLEQGED